MAKHSSVPKYLLSKKEMIRYFPVVCSVCADVVREYSIRSGLRQFRRPGTVTRIMQQVRVTMHA
ncbi:MAG TPA: hypothetical protein O0Y06_07530 [Methanocorpusculum sp.]|nr:hypothetical protein [Methanocorpusculum sp.]HJK80736.1 hypothetical protein [Methanocorpusculum sp.]